MSSILDAGDSIYFAADAIHRYANATSNPCVYYVAALIMRPRGNRTARVKAPGH
jgi:quercetin dioxygenase-like cupin family protein